MKIAMSKDEDSSQCSQNLLQKKADFSLNFQHLGASATRLSIMLINKKGEDITDSAPPVEVVDELLQGVLPENTRFPFPPLGLGHTSPAAATAIHVGTRSSDR